VPTTEKVPPTEEVLAQDWCDFQLGLVPAKSFQLEILGQAHLSIVTCQISCDITCAMLRRAIAERMNVAVKSVSLCYRGETVADEKRIASLGLRGQRCNETLAVYVDGIVKISRPRSPSPPPPPRPPMPPPKDVIRMCGRFGFPVDNMACDNLSTHNANGRNHCPRCGWFKPKFNEWPFWDEGVLDRIWDSKLGENYME